MSQINELARETTRHRLTIPGVQPKLSLALDKTKKQEERLTIVGLWNGIFILKPAHESFRQLPENEDVTMHMAETCGIKTAAHGLIRFKSGELAYIARRFDRKFKRGKIEKLHQEDMCQLTGLLTENKYDSSMEKIAKAVNQYTTNKGLELLTLFQVTIFSFLTGNSDMHLKNFSIIKEKDGTVGFTPAYDLLASKIVMPEDKEELALTLNGKKHKLNRKDFDIFADHCGIPVRARENVFRDFEQNFDIMKHWIQKSFLSSETQAQYLRLIAERAEILKIKTPDKFEA
jgi:serine/threonine-protein kinase HipA